jgi:hypothetical protein
MGALDVYDDQRTEQIENGPFSEEFILDPSGTATPIRGIYDDSYITDERDQGNVRQQKRKPLILISEIPSGIVPKTTLITVRGVDRKIQKIDRDENGIPRLWLI